MDCTAHSSDIHTAEIVEGNILLVTLRRPKALNSIPASYHARFTALWKAFEADQNLVAAILTGEGKLFSAGADLKEWKDTVSMGKKVPIDMEGGFLGISNRSSKKPIIAAINGAAYGGGTEAIVNCDLAVIASKATLALPEVRRGVTAIAGALPRIGREFGLKRANELALLGEPISAQKALEWGLVNQIVPEPKDVVPAAIEYAHKLALGSPEAVSGSLISVRRGIEDTKLTTSEAAIQGAQYELRQVAEMDNVKEGLDSFVQKRDPKWKPSKL
ncbi:hypothetical protein TRICI_001588 [Trichomonascus ciferrii]|uniref:Enoyl-CoA hydratase n=1 Tax=Trichomonascus ciferrii TaxID=44093 RepID=A0A642VAK2_9ASCO|nr:hypothetical protein TRICI_001588 [Trichomonascus ciferrii]